MKHEFFNSELDMELTDRVDPIIVGNILSLL